MKSLSLKTTLLQLFLLICTGILISIISLTGKNAILPFANEVVSPTTSKTTTKTTTKANRFNSSCEITPFKSFSQYLDYFQDTSYLCEGLTTAGGQKILGYLLTDGHKWICPKTPYMNKGNCIVYSFGINNEWSFDDSISNNFGCKVFAFDPTMSKPDHKRSELITFFNLGVSFQNGNQTIGGKNCKVSRLTEIYKMLNHSTKTIDVLKMDIEGSELKVMEDVWNTAPDFLQNYVSQIAMEIHIGGKLADHEIKWVTYWTMIQRLECLGFRLVHAEPNRQTRGYTTKTGLRAKCCYELLWLNTNLISGEKNT